MAPRIPGIFHFIFGFKPQVEPFGLMYYLCLRSCLDVMRPDKVFLYYHHEPWGPWWDEIRGSLALERVGLDETITGHRYADPAIAPFRYAHQSDVTRLEILRDRGGVYADIDSLFLRPFPDDFHDQPFVMGREKLDLAAPAGAAAGGSLCNALMLSEPRAGFVIRWLAELPAAFDGSWSNHSTFLPHVLARRHPDLIDVQPEASFYAFSWDPEDVNALFTRPLARELGRSYSLHLWNHLWADAARASHSWFHAGLLTPAYVGWSTSAYATLARRFLPPSRIPSRARFLLESRDWSLRAAAWRLRRAIGV